MHTHHTFNICMLVNVQTLCEHTRILKGLFSTVCIFSFLQTVIRIHLSNKRKRPPHFRWID